MEKNTRYVSEARESQTNGQPERVSDWDTIETFTGQRKSPAEIAEMQSARNRIYEHNQQRKDFYA